MLGTHVKASFAGGHEAVFHGMRDTHSRIETDDASGALE